MIVVDTSALIAILFGEPEALNFAKCLAREAQAYIAAPTVFEFRMVARGRRKAWVDDEASLLLDAPGLIVLPWTADHAAIAFQAFGQFGRGHHSARLNFGDCMAYALAKSLDAPLLYKGNDFAQTDIRSAV